MLWRSMVGVYDVFLYSKNVTRSSRSPHRPQNPEFASSEISQTWRDFLEYLNRSNTLYANLKVQTKLAPTLPRIGTGHVGHAKIEISQRIRTPKPKTSNPEAPGTRILCGDFPCCAVRFF